MKKITKRFLPMMIALILLASMAVSAGADQTGSITYSYPLSGAAFRLYRVGEADGADGFVLTGDFADYAVDLTADTAAATLAAYVGRDQTPALAEHITDEAGGVRFEGLAQGVYLLVGQTGELDDIIYTPQPILVSLPNWDEDTLVWDVQISGKYDKYEKYERVDIQVLKIWNDSENTAARPESIRIQLLRDNEVYDAVNLSPENNWRYGWTDLEGKYTWSVAEEEVPAGYSVSITRDGTGFVVINSRPGTPDKPELPQTGQLWWPVSILAGVGMVLLALGLIRRGKGSYGK